MGVKTPFVVMATLCCFQTSFKEHKVLRAEVFIARFSDDEALQDVDSSTAPFGVTDYTN